MAVFFLRVEIIAHFCIVINQQDIMADKKRICLSDGSSVNSYGVRVDVSGIDLNRFTSNPVMLYMHCYDDVVGRWENIAIESNKLVADPVFDDGDEQGANIKRKFENDFLRAASMGITIKDMAEVDGVWVITKSELLEASIVSVPSDAGAIVFYDDNRKVLSIDQVDQLKLSFNNNQLNSKKMPFELSQKTKDSLQLSGEFTPKEVELAVAEKDKKITELEAQVKTQTEAQYSAFLDGAEKDGKITAAEKPELLTLSIAGGFKNVKAIVDGKTTSPSASLADQVTKTNLSAGREGWDYVRWMKEDSKGLMKLKAENPKEFERLQLTIKN